MSGTYIVPAWLASADDLRSYTVYHSKAEAILAHADKSDYVCMELPYETAAHPWCPPRSSCVVHLARESDADTPPWYREMVQHPSGALQSGRARDFADWYLQYCHPHALPWEHKLDMASATDGPATLALYTKSVADRIVCHEKRLVECMYSHTWVALAGMMEEVVADRDLLRELSQTVEEDTQAGCCAACNYRTTTTPYWLLMLRGYLDIDCKTESYLLWVSQHMSKPRFGNRVVRDTGLYERLEACARELRKVDTSEYRRYLSQAMYLVTHAQVLYMSP